MKTILRNIMAITLAAAFMTSCSMWNNETNGAVLGGIGGALVGGALGEMVGGHHGSHIGAQVGATIGTVAGASAGREEDRKEAEQRYYYLNGGNYANNRESYYDEQSGVTYVRINRDGDLTFQSNSTRFDGSSSRNLNRIYRDLARCSNDIYIYGSTDSRERNGYQLSEQRAKLVARYLVSQGISQRRIHTVALGNDNPIGDNNTQYGRQLNRSVEVFIVR